MRRGVGGKGSGREGEWEGRGVGGKGEVFPNVARLERRTQL